MRGYGILGQENYEFGVGQHLDGQLPRGTVIEALGRDCGHLVAGGL